MNRVESLEHEVKTLTPAELAAFRDWFADFDSDVWDRKIEADVKAGKLDRLATAARNAHQRGDMKAQFPSRSKLLQDALREKLQRIDHSRLANECAKLSLGEEQALANEHFTAEAKWPEY